MEKAVETRTIWYTTPPPLPTISATRDVPDRNVTFRRTPRRAVPPERADLQRERAGGNGHVLTSEAADRDLHRQPPAETVHRHHGSARPIHRARSAPCRPPATAVPPQPSCPPQHAESTKTPLAGFPVRVDFARHRGCRDPARNRTPPETGQPLWPRFPGWVTVSVESAGSGSTRPSPPPSRPGPHVRRHSVFR